MQITFNIDSSQLGETVIDLLNNLTTKQKKELAYEVVKGWFLEPNTIERVAMEESIINKLRATNERESLNYLGEQKYFKDMEDHEIKRTHLFRQEMEKFKSSKTSMLEEIQSQMINYFKQKIAEELKEDPRVTETKTIALETVKEMLPHIAVEAMVKNFVSQLYNNSYRLYDISMQTDQITNVVNTIAQKIGEQSTDRRLTMETHEFYSPPQKPPGI